MYLNWVECFNIYYELFLCFIQTYYTINSVKLVKFFFLSKINDTNSIQILNNALSQVLHSDKKNINLMRINIQVLSYNNKAYLI